MKLFHADVLPPLHRTGQPRPPCVKQRARRPQLQGADRRRGGPAPERGLRRGLDPMLEKVSRVFFHFPPSLLGVFLIQPIVSNNPRQECDKEGLKARSKLNT